MRRRRMPLPPPPAAALTSSGSPCSPANAATASGVGLGEARDDRHARPPRRGPRAADLSAHQLDRRRPADRSSEPAGIARARAARRARRGSRSPDGSPARRRAAPPRRSPRRRGRSRPRRVTSQALDAQPAPGRPRRVHRRRRAPEPAQRARDPRDDLAAVGDQHPVEHQATPVDRSRGQRVRAERAPEHVAHRRRRGEHPLERDAGGDPHLLEHADEVLRRDVAGRARRAPGSRRARRSSTRTSSTPAPSAASTLASPCPRVLWKCAVSSASRRGRRRRSARRHRIRHAGRVAEADLGRAGRREPPRHPVHALARHVALVGAAERDADHRVRTEPARPGAGRARARAPASDSSTLAPTFGGCGSRTPRGSS